MISTPPIRIQPSQGCISVRAMERGNVNAYFQGLADDFLKTLGKRMRDETLNSGSIGSQGPRNGRAAVRDQVKLE